MKITGWGLPLSTWVLLTEPLLLAHTHLIALPATLGMVGAIYFAICHSPPHKFSLKGTISFPRSITLVAGTCDGVQVVNRLHLVSAPHIHVAAVTPDLDREKVPHQLACSHVACLFETT